MLLLFLVLRPATCVEWRSVNEDFRLLTGHFVNYVNKHRWKRDSFKLFFLTFFVSFFDLLFLKDLGLSVLLPLQLLQKTKFLFVCFMAWKFKKNVCESCKKSGEISVFYFLNFSKTEKEREIKVLFFFNHVLIFLSQAK